MLFATRAYALNVVRLLPDPARPRIYAIDTNGLEQGSLLVIDTQTHNTLKTIPLGKKPTDCDIVEGGQSLLAINSVDQSITEIDLNTLAVIRTIPLPAYNNWGASDTHAHLRAGKGDMVYYVDGQWGPRLRVFNRATGTVLQTFGAKTTGTDNDDGIGGLVLAPDGSAIYTWKQYGWSAGVLGTYISKFSINSNGTLTYVKSSASARSPNFDRDPLDSPAMISPDGSRLFVKDRVFLTSDLSETGTVYPDEIYSISRNAEIAAGASAVYAGKGGEILYSLPASSPVQTITPDYASMVYFHPTNKVLTWLDLIGTIGAKTLGLVIEPADGGTVAQPSRLQWIPITGINRYQVFLGATRSVVESATTASGTFLGESPDPWFVLPTSLSLGQTYYWRVVPVGADGSPAGSGITRSFTVSNVTLSRSVIETATVEGVPRHVETIDLTAASPQSWSATANVPWITFENTSGTTPGKLVVRCDTTSLATGYRQGIITVNTGGSSFTVPVNLRVYAANYMISEADLEHPWIYAVSQESNTSSQPSYLVRINTATDTIESAVSCGTSVTDLAVHYQENRIYLTNWQTGILRAFDRDTFQQVQTYQFAPMGPIGYGEGGVWRVAAGKKGRVILEEADQWIDIRLINTANGAIIASNSSEYAGDGESDPTGRYYYHNESLSSSGSLTRFDLGADTFTVMAPAGNGQGSTVVMIGDGSKVSSGTRMFNSQLDYLYALPSAVLAASLHGDLLFTGSKAYNGVNGLELATLPVTTSVMSVSGDQKKLYQFPANSKSFRVTDLSTIAMLPPREMTPGIGNGSTVIGTHQSLTWSIEPFATSYRVYFGTNRGAVENASETSPEYLGTSATNTWPGTLPALALDGNYFWRVDTVGFSGSNKGTVWSFNVAPLAIDPLKLDLVLPVGAPEEARTLAISGPAGATWTASTLTPWLRVVTPSGSVPGTAEIRVNVAGLTAGTRQGFVTFQSGTDTWNLPVSLELLALNYTLAEADLQEPYVYAISQAASGTDDRAFMVKIDTRISAVSRVIPVGRSATDLAIHYGENRIYVSNWTSGKLLAYDRTTLELKRTYSYAASGGYGTSSGDVYQVAAGGPGRIITEQEDQWINTFLIDTASGNKLATVSVREGGGLFDPTGRYYYHGENDSSGAALIKFDTAGDKFTNLVSKRVSTFSYYGSRRVVASGDGSRVFWNGGVFDADLNVKLLLTDEVVSSTYRGEVLFTDDSAFNGISGEKLASLPVITPIQAVSADQKKLFLFKGGAVSVTDIGTIAQVSPRGLIPGIADGSTVIGTSQQLSWSQEAAALSYDVYFGNSQSEVAAATPTSPEFLGNVTGLSWTGSLPTLALGGTYWWRIDIRGFSSTITGTPWSFKIAPIDVLPRSLDLAFPANSPIPRQKLNLTSSTPLPWSASTITPWITLRGNSGSAPASLEFDLTSSGLATGLHQGSITFSSGGDQFTVPVKLRVLALNVTKLIAHPTRPVVYGINTAAAGEGFSHLLEIDVATANILRSIPIGFSPTDADIDEATDRLYISNWGYSQTRVIDLGAWKELPALNLGEDVYRLNLASGGRILTEEQDQWISLDMWNSSTGGKLASAPSIREGDGETDPTGRFYYHCDNNISDAHLTKYNVSANSFVNVAESGEFGYGSRNLVLSGDGARIFWVSRVFDSGLNLLGTTPAEVFAASSGGDLALGSDKLWWGDSGTEVATLPFTSKVAVFSANDSHIVRFNASTRTLHTTALSSVTDLPGPLPRPGQVLAASPLRISWSPVPGAISYRVFIAPDAAALAAMTSPVATVSTTYYDLPSPLTSGRFYTWRVDAVTISGVTGGKAQSFGIRYPDGPSLAIPQSSITGTAVAMSGQHLLVGGDGSAQLYQFDTTTGTASPVQALTTQSPSWDSDFGTAVAMDSGKAALGDPAFDNPADGGGASYVYRPSNPYGFWEHGGPLAPTTPMAYDGFGKSIAASGNLMLIGSAGNSSYPGKVTAYITEPSTVLTQTFSAADGVANDGFGSVISLEGNQAVISSPGRGSNYSRLPVLYAYSRQTSTGQWTQTQKITISGANTYSTTATALALSGDLMATNNGANSSVVVYAKGTNGLWSQSALISQSSVPGSSSYSFGGALALAGDQLFIGDVNATYGGKSGGAVFSFRRSGSTWTAGPVIVPPAASYSGFGKSLAVRDGWLLAAGGTSSPAWLFHVDEAANHIPVFAANIPTQVVSGRAFSYQIHGEDKDGTGGLLFDLLQGPSWMNLTNGSDGTATLSGTAPGATGSVHTVQLRLRDTTGGSSLHTYQLTVLSASDVPKLVQTPIGGAFGEGREVILRAAASGTGPLVWQWYHDGESVPGADRSSLILDEISQADGGSYVVRVSNAVGAVESTPVSVEVTAASANAGDWPTFGGSTRHTGYHPAIIGNRNFVPAWSASVAPGSVLNRASIAEGKVFVTQSYSPSTLRATALDLQTGAMTWTHSFTPGNSLNPTTYHQGKVYIQRGNHSSDTQLWALDAASGTTVWSSPHGAQWENYEAPAVTDEGIWVNGGTYGGLYGFNLNGTQRFFRDLPQYDEWTPTVSNGRLFSWVEGVFTEHNPADGNTLWSVSTGWNWQGWSMGTVSAVSGDTALVISTTELVCIDLPSRSIRWRKTGVYAGSPAMADGRAYAIKGKTVESYSLANGVPGPVATVPETILSAQPLLLRDHLFVAGANKTYVVRRSDSTIAETLDGGGLLSYSNGTLLSAGRDGILRAWRSGIIEFVTHPPDLTAGPAAEPAAVDFASMIRDSEGGTRFKWRIATVTNPSIFRSLTIDENGRMDVDYAPFAWGSSDVTVEVTSESGTFGSATFRINLPKPSEPVATLIPGIKFNRSNGLFEQKITVTNPASRPIAGFVLTVTGLKSGMVFQNATVRKNGGGTYNYRNPIAPGATAAVTLQYYVKKRGNTPSPDVKITLAPQIPGTASIKSLSIPVLAGSATKQPIATQSLANPPSNQFEVSGVFRTTAGNVVITFPTVINASYKVQYTGDLKTWKTCPDVISGTGGPVDWVDRGPPSTDPPPSSATRRFYRVQRIIP